MPLARTNTQNPIRNVLDNLSREQHHDCQAVIVQLQFADLGRGAGTLHGPHGRTNARLDLQGRTAARETNLQVQIGNQSLAAVLVAATALDVDDPGNQNGVANAVRAALNQSLDSGTIWQVTGTLP